MNYTTGLPNWNFSPISHPPSQLRDHLNVLHDSGTHTHTVPETVHAHIHTHKRQHDPQRSLMGIGGSCCLWGLGPSVLPAYFERPPVRPPFPAGAWLSLSDGRPDFHRGLFWGQWLRKCAETEMVGGERLGPLTTSSHWASPLLTLLWASCHHPPHPLLQLWGMSKQCVTQWSAGKWPVGWCRCRRTVYSVP